MKINNKIRIRKEDRKIHKFVTGVDNRQARKRNLLLITIIIKLFSGETVTSAPRPEVGSMCETV